MAEAADGIDLGLENEKVPPHLEIKLSLDDLPLLLDRLLPLVGKWEEFARFLPKFKNSVASIENVKAGNKDACGKLFDIMNRWLNEATPEPTVMDLLKALRADFIGENKVARDIEKEFNKRLTMPPQKSATSSATPTLPKAAYDRSKSLPATLQDHDLKADTIKRHSTATQANSSEPLATGLGVSQQSGVDCNTDEQLAITCGCAVKCSIIDIVSRKCPSPKSTTGFFPQLVAKHLSETEKEMLCGQLYRQFLDISKKYASLTSSVRDSLKQRGITAADLTEKLMDLNGFLPLREESNARLLESHYPEMKEAEKITDLFDILRSYHSYFNYEIIRFIVEELGTEEDKGNLEKYEEDFTEYCKRSIFECPLPSDPKRSSDRVDLIMKVDSKSMTEPYTAEAVKLFKFQVATLLQITKYALYLHSVEKGCLQLTFHIPRFLTSAMFLLNTDQKRGLKELGIIRLECDGIVHHMEPDNVIDVPESAVRSKPRGASSIESKVQRENPCLNFKLLGRCKSGSKCKYSHEERHPNPLEEYVLFPAERPSDFQPPIGRMGYSSSRKGYVVVESDRDPTKEVKVVAEDEDAIEYARRIIYRRSKPYYMPKGERVCVKLKLLGSCDDEQCPYKHEGVIPLESPKRDYVQNPGVGTSASIKKCIGRIGYTKNNECYLTVQSDRHPEKEVLVYAENDDALEYGISQITILIGRTYTSHYLTYCYVHPEEVEDPNLTLKFRRRAQKDSYGIVKVDSTPSEEAPPTYSLESFINLNPRSDPSVTLMLDSPEMAREGIRRNCKHMRILQEYKRDINMKLREGLQWMFENGLKPKLEGRLGKLCFSHVLQDIRDAEGFHVSRLINFLFKNEGYKRFFYPEVSEQARSALQRSMLTESGSITTTYDMKLGVKGKGKLDIRLQFPDGKPQVVQVKKNESKVLIFDVLCLNSEHDMRVSLNAINIGSSDDSTVLNFLTTVTMPRKDTVSFVPLGPDEEWTVRMLRQKIRKAYFINNLQSSGKFSPKYMVTISSVHEYEIKTEDLKSCDTIEVGPRDSRVHTEIELHNLNWMLAVGNELGLTTEQSLILLMEPDKIPADLLSKSPAAAAESSSRWTPQMIMKDFEEDDFFQIMYNLNRAVS